MKRPDKNEANKAQAHMVYMDNNATTRVRSEVLEAMAPFFGEKYGNPSSIHRPGQLARKAVEDAREIVASGIGAEPKEIIFTSGGTESNNFAIRGIAHALRNRGDHIVTSSIEHHAVLNPCRGMEDMGFRVTYLPVDRYGLIDPGDVKKALDDKTILVTIMMANNETGAIQPIEDIGHVLKDKGVCFHTDAVQAFGKIPIDVDRANIDILSVSGHKIYAPKGIGALYIRSGTRIDPIITGGHHEREYRAGTENVPGIVGLAVASDLALKEMSEQHEILSAMRYRLYRGIKDSISEVLLNGHPEKSLPNTLNVSFAGVEGESIVVNLDLKGIAVSSGSACTSGASGPSHVLTAMGTDPALARGSVRFSLGRYNKMEEIEYTLEQTKKIICRLRKISPISGA